MLFGRKWRLVAGPAEASQQIEITALRIGFKVERGHKRKQNDSTIDIYNLGPDSRAKLSQDEGATGARKAISASLEAGYEDAFPLIFQGKIHRVSHRREGPDWITSLEADDGPHQLMKARISKAFKAGTKVTDAFKAIADELGVGLGNALEEFKQGNFSRGITEYTEGLVLAGTGKDVIDRLMDSAGLEYSVQNETLVVTRKGYPLPGQAVLLSRDTGLIGSPHPGDKGILRCKALIRPGLEPARQVQLQAAAVEGLFRVERVVYSGDTHGTDWYAELDLRRSK